MKRIRYQDKYNPVKEWEVTTYSSGNRYLKQFISGRQFGKGKQVTKKWLESMGMTVDAPIIGVEM